MANSAVITGDIVNSTLLSTKLEKQLKNEIIKTLEPNKFEFYRGDSFQACIKSPKDALTIVVRIRAIARRISPDHDVRASIGIGKINAGLRKLSTATGEAFILSGRAFDTLLNTDRNLTINSKNAIANHGFEIISYFVDFIFKSLTEKQAEVVLVLLADKTQLEAAKKLRKSPSTINKHAQSGGWREIMTIISEYQELVAKL